MALLKHFLTGFLIGLANLIPGVSGGTFALILGVYERLITFLNRINSHHLVELLSLVVALLKNRLSKTSRDQLTSFLISHDYPFMTVLGIGATFCILAMSSLMKYLLLHHFTYTYAYFFGLIVLSVIIPWRMIRNRRAILFVPLMVGVLLTVSITVSVNPYDKALKKSNLLQSDYSATVEQEVTSGTAKVVEKFSFTGKYSLAEYGYIFVCGVIAISAMVLPGVSGSLVLILMNQYFAVISAIANIPSLLLDDLLFLAVMTAGILFGLLSFARLIEYAFRKYHDPMISFLVGLIVGSLYALWPFKQAEVIPLYFVKEGATIERIENFIVYSNINTLPTDQASGILATLAVLAGMVSMIFFVRREKP